MSTVATQDSPPLERLSLDEKRALLKRLLREKSSGAGRPFQMIDDADRRRLGDEVEDAYPLSKMQAGMLFHSELKVSSSVYHDLHSMLLRGPYEAVALEKSVRQLVELHPILRTAFDLSSFSEPLQLVYRQVEIPLKVEDLRDLPPPEQEAFLDNWFTTERRRQLDCSRPSIDFDVHRLADDRFYFTIGFHHAVLDGWSATALFAELFRFYVGIVNGDPPPSRPLKATFRDFVRLEREALESGAARELWARKLADCTRTELPRWPTAKIGGGMERREARVLDVPISDRLSEQLHREARTLGVPVKSVLLAAHMRTLSALSGRRDVLTGLVTHGRPEQADGDRVLGVFLNTLPFRVRLHSGSWRDLVRQVFEEEKELFPYRRFPVAEIQKQQGGGALFASMFNFMHWHTYRGMMTLGGMEVIDEYSYEETNLSLLANFMVFPDTSRIVLSLNWPSSEFVRDEMRAVIACYQRVLTALVDAPLADHRMFFPLSAPQRHQLLVEWNATQASYGRARTLHEVIAEQACQTPEATALVFESATLSYRELNRRANRLAHYLGGLGVGPDVAVGIAMERSLELVVGLMGILKAGGAYVPLDPSYPRERLAFMVEDARLTVLLSAEDMAPVPVPEGPRKIFSARDRTRADNLAYTIYTSGSTGRPKGVMNSHRGIWNRLCWMQDAYGLDASDRVLQKTPMSFDVSVWEFFWPLMTGACLVMARPDGHRDAGHLQLRRFGLGVFLALMRLFAARLDQDTHHFLWSHHHLLLDGWSLPVILNEVFSFYRAFAQGRDFHLRRPRPYRDYIAWLQKLGMEEAEAAWRQTLEGFTATRLEGDRPGGTGVEHGEVGSRLSEATTAALEGLAKDLHVTLNTFLQGVWAVVVSRYTGERKVVFGATVSGRPADLEGVEAMVGLFINTLPVALEVAAQAPLGPWLQQLQAQQVRLRRYQHAPLARIHQWSGVRSGEELFNSILVFENYPVKGSPAEANGDLRILRVDAVEITNYPLTVVAAPGPRLRLGIAFQRRSFDETTVRRLLRQIELLLESMASRPGQRLGELELLRRAERHQVLVEWQARPLHTGPLVGCIHHRFEELAERQPQALAVATNGVQLSYAELNRRANRLARYLRALGVGPETPVTIFMERSPEMVVGLLGVLKAGGGYVPLDPSNPPRRLAYLLDDSRQGAASPVVLTQQRLLDRLPARFGRAVLLDRPQEEIEARSCSNPDPVNGLDHLAYMIYTSGSTGRPKGVQVTHRTLLHFLGVRRSYHRHHP